MFVRVWERELALTVRLFGSNGSHYGEMGRVRAVWELGRGKPIVRRKLAGKCSGEALCSLWDTWAM